MAVVLLGLLSLVLGFSKVKPRLYQGTFRTIQATQTNVTPPALYRRVIVQQKRPQNAPYGVTVNPIINARKGPFDSARLDSASNKRRVAGEHQRRKQTLHREIRRNKRNQTLASARGLRTYNKAQRRIRGPGV